MNYISYLSVHRLLNKLLFLYRSLFKKEYFGFIKAHTNLLDSDLKYLQSLVGSYDINLESKISENLTEPGTAR